MDRVRAMKSLLFYNYAVRAYRNCSLNLGVAERFASNCDSGDS
jgi:hypothetical protein